MPTTSYNTRITITPKKIGLVLDPGPALSRCSCIGPRAMVFGYIVNFCQIHLALENSVETPHKVHC